MGVAGLTTVAVREVEGSNREHKVTHGLLTDEHLGSYLSSYTSNIVLKSQVSHRRHSIRPRNNQMYVDT